MEDKINNAKNALEWFKHNPKKRLYDEFGNYYWHVPDENIVEYHHKVDDWDWDFEKFSEHEFLELGEKDFYFE